MSETPSLINGLPANSVDVLDRGLNYGDGIFRTIRAHSGQLVWWRDQYDKLVSDCAALKLSCPDESLLHTEAQQLVFQFGDGIIKIMITRGIGQRGYVLPKDSDSTRIVAWFPSSVRENRDVNVRWCDLRLGHQPRLAGIKHLNRLENVLARSEWNDPDIAEGFLLDEAGHVICGTMTNLFVVEQRRLITSDLSLCGVAGVTRGRIMRAAESHGQAVAIERIVPARLLASEAVLLCNSLTGIWRVAELGQTRWADTGWAEKLRSWLSEYN